MTNPFYLRKTKHSLKLAQDLVRQGKCILTKTAILDGANLGFSETEIKDIILKLNNAHFYHSTLEKFNHKVYQDVYKITITNLNLYIKLKIINNNEKLLIISFKEDTAER